MKITDTSLQIVGRDIIAAGSDHGRSSLGIDADGLLVLPGIVDLHGRRLRAADGCLAPASIFRSTWRLSTATPGDQQRHHHVYHATTWSWEPGLRSGDNARCLLEAIEAMRPQLAADTRFHLRHETYISMPKPKSWIGCRKDVSTCSPSTTIWIRRSPASPSRRSAAAWWNAPVSRATRSDRLVESVGRRAMTCRPRSPGGAGGGEANVRMLSHDDDSPEMRKAFVAGRRHRRISGQ